MKKRLNAKPLLINIDLDILKYLKDNCINKTQIINKLLRDFITKK